jgi:hypothetical protein
VAEIIRTVAVVIEVDTNKQTRSRKLVLDDDETLAEFKQRIDETVNQLVGVG